MRPLSNVPVRIRCSRHRSRWARPVRRASPRRRCLRRGCSKRAAGRRSASTSRSTQPRRPCAARVICGSKAPSNADLVRAAGWGFIARATNAGFIFSDCFRTIASGCSLFCSAPKTKTRSRRQWRAGTVWRWKKPSSRRVRAAAWCAAPRSGRQHPQAQGSGRTATAGDRADRRQCARADCRSDVVARPLEGLRVLDLTRVLAGPTCARTLAEHGADVLRIGTLKWPDNEAMMRDTGFGKRSAALDLRRRRRTDVLRGLIRRRRRFLTGLPARRAGEPRLRTRRGRRAAARHRLCEHQRIRPHRALAGAPRLRQRRAVSQRHRARARWRRRASALRTGQSARLYDRLPGGGGCACGIATSSARRRQLPGAGVAGADGSLARELAACRRCAGCAGFACRAARGAAWR